MEIPLYHLYHIIVLYLSWRTSLYTYTCRSKLNNCARPMIKSKALNIAMWPVLDFHTCLYTNIYLSMLIADPIFFVNFFQHFCPKKKVTTF